MIENYQDKYLRIIDLGSILYLKKLSKKSITISCSTLDIKYGTSLTSSNRMAGGIPLLASNGIIDMVNKSNSLNPVTFGCRGTLGNVFFQKGEAFVLNTALYIDNAKNYGNLYFALKYNNALIEFSSGAAQPQITIEAIKSALIDLPSDNDLNHILDLASKYQNILNNLNKLKQLLLTKYF